MTRPAAATRRMRQTKIVATLGPASSEAGVIGALLDAGVNAFRLNFSHGSHQTHTENIARVRQVAAERGVLVPLIADLQGPKVRVGRFKSGEAVELRAGEEVRLTPNPEPGDARIVPVDYRSLARHVSAGERILLDDGSIELKVLRIDGTDVVCEIVAGGRLGERKGVNIPGSALDLPALTVKDRQDLRFALEAGVDYIAVSFVRQASDIAEARELVREAGADAHIIAKLEKPQALDNLEAILDEADVVMVARGDLGVELSPWRVPIEQKRIIEEAALRRKPVITATQMLESMMTSASPTRAEASDVANAVFDGSDALMLSGETAVGSYPVESVRMMSRIIGAAEEKLVGASLPPPVSEAGEEADLSDAVAHGAVRLAERVGARCVVVYSQSGFTARLISKHRPRNSLILGLSTDVSTCRRMELYWGVRTQVIGLVDHTDALTLVADVLLAKLGWAEKGDLICITAGTPLQLPGKTNLIKLHRVGDASLEDFLKSSGRG